MEDAAVAAHVLSEVACCYRYLEGEMKLLYRCNAYLIEMNGCAMLQQHISLRPI